MSKKFLCELGRKELKEFINLNEDRAKCIILNAKPTRQFAPRWVVVRDLFGVGSTTSTEICRHFGLDPYEPLNNPDWPEEEYD